jgi:predicted metal-dependent HD superfamily phosphohydrolase
MIRCSGRVDAVSHEGNKVLLSSWLRCWRSLEASGDGIALMQKLTTAYAEPQRSYHTIQHLNECLALLEPHLELAEHPAEVEIALWFHDAVYDVKAKDNEARSAAWAETELNAAAVAPEAIGRINKLIMVTCHAAAPEGRDQQLLVDVDLSILGAPRPRFIEYEAQVRKEYDWVPGWLFRRKRRGILKEFLARDPIYNTPQIRGKLESQARENLAYCLSQLRG